MKAGLITSLFGIALVASTLAVAGCGDSGEDAVAQLPESSTVTLETVKAPDNDAEGKLCLGDTSSGEIFRVKTKPESRLSAYQWVSPTQMIVAGYYRDFYLLDIDAKTLKRLPESMGGTVTFSHSGEFMAMTAPTGELQIWSVKDNTQVSTIQAGPTGYALWSPDDKHIFWPGAPSGIADVGPRPAPVSADTGEGGLSAAWSMDGRSIVFNGGDGIYSINPDSGAKTLLHSWPAGLTPLPDAPRLSADGKYALASARDVAQGSFRAIIVPLDGSTKGVQVTSVWPADAVWSPAEDVLAVVGDWCQVASHLLLLNADGSVKSTFEGASQIPAFSADGSAIAYVGPDPQGGKDEGLVVRDVAGGSVTAFLPGFLRGDIWSPDGRWVAYTPGSLSYQCMDVSGSTQVLPFP